MSETLAQIPLGRTQILAQSSNIDGNALATTVLTFYAGATLAKFVPVAVRITRKTGTFLLAVLNLRDSGGIILPIPAVSMALLGASADNLIIPLAAINVKNSGNLSLEVATINGGASTFDIDVIGSKYAL